MQNIRILEGSYKIRGKDVDLAGMVFPLVEEFKVGAKGGYVTVDGKAVAGFPDRNIKIACTSDASYEDASGAQITQREETDEETIERLRERFDMLEDMTRATKKGDVRAMIVSGPPGVGKSFGVEKVLGKHDLIAQLGDRPAKYEVVKGAMSAIGLYVKLYKYADKDNVIVFDDCDPILAMNFLNILKAGLNQRRHVRSHWNTDTRWCNEGARLFPIPVVLFLSPNQSLHKAWQIPNIPWHLKAPSMWILTIDTEREKMLRNQTDCP